MYLILEHFRANFAAEGGDVDVRRSNVPRRPRVLDLHTCAERGVSLESCDVNRKRVYLLQYVLYK